MRPRKRWNIASPFAAAGQLAASLKISPLIAQVLLNRGIEQLEDCQRFLWPSLKYLHEPGQLPNLVRAAERIDRAVRAGEKIVIYGDYDVDGITGTAILWHAIRLLGGQAEYYIPHRLEEGYGLNAEAIGQICDGGAKLIITVDCGITAIEEADLARQRGVEMIVTDHHEPRERLPKCFAVVHPRLDGQYPNPYLCGAGVAFKLAWGLGQVHGGAERVDAGFRRFLIEATALAALGTIADVVPLVGENRLLAHFGLAGLKQSELVGIRALIESANLTGQKLDSYHVGFLLAPRLNACGRMGHARQAVELLTTTDAEFAKHIATELEQLNRNRQGVERQIFEQAMAQVSALGMDREEYRGIVLADETWHAGVIGIVASRIVNRLNRPTVLIALSNGAGQGSGRSISGFHLAKALDACREHLEGCGGHEMAAGLRMQGDKLAAFREAFCAYANATLSPEMLLPQLYLDCVAELRQITEGLVSDLARLGPFGTSNRRPLLCCANVELAGEPRRVGRNAEHLQLFIRQGSAAMKCIAFSQGDRSEELHPGLRIDLAVEPCLNEYNGRRSVELEVKDIRPAEG